MKTAIEHEPTQLSADDRSATVTVCHKTGNGQYQPLIINRNALQAHLNHGDYLPDADADGYTAIGACTGSMDDCDDNNPDVHPGATEVCGNWIDDDCDGYLDSDDLDSDCACVYSQAELEELLSAAPYDADYNTDTDYCFETLFSELYWIFISFDQGTTVLAGEFNDPVSGQTAGAVSYINSAGSYCFFQVGINLTEEEYQAARAAILEAMEENPTTSICDLFFSSAGTVENPEKARRFRAFSNQMNNMPPKVKQMLPK